MVKVRVEKTYDKNSNDLDIQRWEKICHRLCITVCTVMFGCMFLVWQVGLMDCPQESVYDASGYVMLNGTLVNRNVGVCSATLERRFDCFPRGVVDEKSCLERGCCWSQLDEDKEIPWCFYPDNYSTYVIAKKRDRPSGINLVLQKTTPPHYPDDVNVLSMKIVYRSKNHVQIKIIDPYHDRYEPPFPEVPMNTESTDDDREFDVIQKEDAFGFAIVRKSSGEVIFDTRDVGGFIYSDQFLQMSAVIPTKYIYGLGERRNNFVLDTNWTQITLFNHDSPPLDGVNLYGTHPFYMAMEKTGLSHGVFLMNSNALDIILQPTPAITYRTIGGILDFHIFLGPRPEDVVAQYTDFVGKPFLPPYWSLGFHLSRFGLKSTEDTYNLWKKTVDAGIPLGVMWNDIDYMDNRNDFTLSPNFTDLPSLVDKLHKNGTRYIMILDPGVSAGEAPGTYPPYDKGIEEDIFIKNASNHPLVAKVWNKQSTVFPDFSNPKTFDYWTGLLQDTYNSYKFDGLWLDMNEISNFVNGSFVGCPFNRWENPPYVPNVEGGQLFYHTICMSAKHYAGIDYDVHNLFGSLQAKMTTMSLSVIQQKRPFILSRATFSGLGHYAAHWTGDVFSTWDDMKHSVGDVMTFNILGIPMVGADICGFNGDTTVELCQRWSQLGAFYPFSRNHNSDDQIDQDPVSLGEAVVESTKKALLTRYQLLPYLYSLFWEAHIYGTTVVKPLFFVFPKDVNTYTINKQFLWGNALMIAPVLDEGATSVDVYFSNTIWYDYYTGTPIFGNASWVNVKAPLDTIPLFAQSGFIMPYTDPRTATIPSNKTIFNVLAACDANGSSVGVLYWDDGESLDVEMNKKYNKISFYMTSATKLASKVEQWGYNHTMLLSTVKIYGLDNSPSSVRVNQETHGNFDHNLHSKKLLIENLKLDLQYPFEIELKYSE